MAGSVSASLLESICGPGSVLLAGRLTFDGPHPAWAVMPAHEEQAAALLARASQEGWAVVPRGGGTQDRLGGPLRQADLLLSTANLRRVVAYEPADLTVTVQAGMQMTELQEMLGAQGQRVPLDAPPGATVGGVVAAAVTGPLRYRFGGPREAVLGMRVALTNGDVIACGARVVKNVAGYDLNKLFTGSMGTLGLITEVTFKVVPIPPVLRTLHYQAPLAAAWAVAESELEPESLTWDSETGLLTVGVAGEAEAVAYHELRLQQLLRTLPVQAGATEWRDAVAPAEERPPTAPAAQAISWHGSHLGGGATTGAVSMAGRPAPQQEEPSRATLRATLPPAAIERFCAEAWQHFPGARVQASLCGVVEVTASPAADLSARISRLDEAATGLGGHLVVADAPAAVKAAVRVWGAPGPGFPLMQALKRQFDPAGILNPGRFVGGL